MPDDFGDDFSPCQDDPADSRDGVLCPKCGAMLENGACPDGCKLDE